MIPIYKSTRFYRILFFATLIGFGIIFCSISLVNHYLFRTSGYDLGINNNAIYDYAHLRWNDCMLMQPHYTNVLSDHFSLYPILVSPLYWIFGSYTMLIVQICAVLFGGVGVYKFILNRSSDFRLALFSMVHFFLMWGIYSALAFDYHDNVVAAMLVPWLFYFFFTGNKTATWCFLVLILISKENMALWSIFIGLGLSWLTFKDKKLRLQALALSLVSLIYFIVVVKLIIPSIGNAGRDYNHFHYAALGTGFSDALVTLFTRPLHILSLLFASPDGNDYFHGIKLETHLMVLLCGGYALLKRPAFLVMLLPIYAQKMFNDDHMKWGTLCQYSIEFAPILAIAFYMWLISYDITTRKILSNFGLILCLIASFLLFQERTSKWYNKESFQFYNSSHYKTPYNVSEIYEALKLIPQQAKVSAEAHIIPHLSFRDYIYHFPHTADAEYIVLLDDWRTYPLNQEQFIQELNNLLGSNEWTALYNKDGFYIFKKNNRLSYAE